jgi:hypothetical protein
MPAVPCQLKCFGRPVTHQEAACLVLCALLTILIDLRAWQLPLHF